MNKSQKESVKLNIYLLAFCDLHIMSCINDKDVFGLHSNLTANQGKLLLIQ